MFMPKIEFTIVYDWLSKRMELSWPEKIILAHILRYGRSQFGCFKSNGNIAKNLGFSRVSVIRIIARLEDSGWVVKRTYPARERSLFVNQEKLDDMPLLAGVKGCGKPVKSSAAGSGAAPQGGSGAAPPGSGAAPQGGSGAAPPRLNRNSKESFLRDIEERKEREERDFSFSENLRERAKPTAEQIEHRKKELLAQTAMMKEQ
jgi:hypothetical protein